MITPFSLPPPDSFENRLRRVRLLRGLSGSEIASKANVSRAAYCRWEGGTQPLMRNVRALSEALGVSLPWLAYGEGPMEALATSKGKNGEGPINQIQTVANV